MSTGTNFPGQNRSSSSRRAFQLIQKDEESQGGSDACVQRTRQFRLARMHVEMAGAGSISHSLLLAFSVLKSSPGPTNHLFRLEHNDNAGSPLNGLVRR